MTRVALINPNWTFDGSIYFGCRSPHLPLELGISQHYLREAGHATLLLDAHMFDLSLSDIHAELSAFRPDMVVLTRHPPICSGAVRRPSCGCRRSSCFRCAICPPCWLRSARTARPRRG